MTSTTGTPLAVVLAAGEGKRMKSSLPKVLHKLAGEPLLGHVLRALGNADVGAIAVVVGPNRPDVEGFVHTKTPWATVAVQHERRGTAHAVLAARDLLATWTSGEILVLFGDTPLIKPPTIKRIRDQLSDGSDIVVTGFYPADSTGYGRLITEGERLLAIREEKDASPEELEVKLCNGGILGLRAGACLRLLGIHRTWSSYEAWERPSARAPPTQASCHHGRGFLLESALPISPDSIHRAAEEMIAEYGPEALAEAKERAQDLRSVGFESAPKTWDLICAVIQDVDD